MRRADHIGQAEEHIGGGGLVGEHIEGAASDMAGHEGIAHGRFINQFAARAIDDAHALLRPGDVFRIHDPARLGRQRRMQSDEIGAPQEIVQLHLLDAHVAGALGREEGIEGDDAHPEAQRPVGDDGADIAAADDAQHLGGDLHAHEAVLLPLARLGGGVGGGDLAGHREHHGDGVFGCGDGIAERRVHHDDAPTGCCGNIDIINANARAANDLEAGRLLQQFGGDLGVGADGEAIVIADDFGEFILVLAEIGLEVDLHAMIPEDLHGGG